MSKSDNENLVIKLYETGMSAKQIQESKKVLNRSGNPVTLRWIQMVLKDHRGETIGRTSHSKLFSLEDVKIMIKSEKHFNYMARKRFREYYEGRNNSLRSLRIANPVLARDKYKCKKCGTYTDLECHHTTHDYDNTYLEMEYCITLCKDCHIKYGNKYKNIRTKFREGDSRY